MGDKAGKVCRGFGECSFELLVFKTIFYFIARNKYRYNLGQII